MTNGDRIRSMSDEELAVIIMCPYDTAGAEVMPCKQEPKLSAMETNCITCVNEWLTKEETIGHCYLPRGGKEDGEEDL